MPSGTDHPMSLGRTRWPLLLAMGGSAVVAAAIWRWDLDRLIATRIQALDPGDELGSRWWSQLFFCLPSALAVWMAALALALAIRSLIRPQEPSAGRVARVIVHPAGRILAFLALGPGLLVNVVLKQCWGRPRPRATAGFGGDQPFAAFWQPGGSGPSFPSGHVAMVVLAAAMWWIVLRPRRPVLAAWGLGLGLAAALMTGFVRMLAQAHWLSDVVFAFAAMLALALAGSRLLAVRWPEGSARLAWRLGFVCTVGLVLRVLLASPCDRAFDLGLPAPDRPEPIDLEVRIAGHPVVIVAYPTLPELVHVDGFLYGYGPPGTSLAPDLARNGAVVRLVSEPKPLAFRRSGEVWVRIDPTRFRSITVTAFDQDVTIAANPGTPIAGIRASAPHGRVILPDWWRPTDALAPPQ